MFKCLKCGAEAFEYQQVRFSPKVKGETVEVIVRTKICKNCGITHMDADDINLLRRAAADKYREMHGLLTSQGMIEFREAFHMSQVAFAKYLVVGEASIKRWETYYIQDASQDDHFRLKCDQYHAELNLLNIIWNKQEPNIYSGGRRFSFELFKNISLFFINRSNISCDHLSKALFYVDFLHYKNHGKSIMGIRYKPLRSGPSPDRHDLIMKILEKEGMIGILDGKTFQTSLNVNLEIFDDAEKRTITRICELSREENDLSALSRREKGFLETHETSYISYEYAHDLLIS